MKEYGHYFSRDLVCRIRNLTGQGKSTYTFSAERLLLSAPPPPLPALLTEAWRVAEKLEDVRRKTYTLIYPDPILLIGGGLPSCQTVGSLLRNPWLAELAWERIRA